MNSVSRKIKRKLLLLLGVYFLTGLAILYFLGNAEIILLIDMFLSFPPFLLVSYPLEKKEHTQQSLSFALGSSPFLYKLNFSLSFKHSLLLAAIVLVTDRGNGACFNHPFFTGL